MSILSKRVDDIDKPGFSQAKRRYISVLLISAIILLVLIIATSIMYIEDYFEYLVYSFYNNILVPFGIIFFLVFLVLFEFNFGDDSWKESNVIRILMFVCLSLVMVLSATLGDSDYYNDTSVVMLALLIGVFIGGYTVGILLLCEIPFTILFAYLFFNMTYDPVIIPTLTSQVIIGLFWCYYLKDGYNYIRAKKAALVAAVILAIHAAITYQLYIIELYSDWASVTVSLVTTIFVIFLATFLFGFCDILVTRDRVGEHFKQDLGLANEIQMSCVPDYDIIEERIRISGMMQPALNVGGDYFDYKKIKEGLYLIVIGDVSDKRLPASLFMLKAKGIIDTASRITYDAGEILTLVNKELCNKNNADLFMTCWIGIVDIDLGIVEYANAGHKAPYILTDEGICAVNMKPEPALGIYDFISYGTQRIELGEKDGLFTYTDGVTECLNKEGEMFGQSNLENSLIESRAECPAGVVSHVYQSVESFADTRSASDDIAMISMDLDRTGYSSFTIQAITDNLDEVLGFINGFMRNRGVPNDLESKIDVIAEELFVNICYYSKMEDDEVITILCYCEDRTFQLTMCDTGVPFDPTIVGTPVLNKKIPNRDIGGLGIHLVRKMSDGFHYRNCHGMNITTVLKRFSDDDQQ